jgi:chitinase
MQKSVNIFILFATIVFTSLFTGKSAFGQQRDKQIAVIAYYKGDGSDIYTYKTQELTHIIYSFLQLKDNLLVVANAKDSLAITRLVAVKKANVGLKIILSMGGWGGCASCSGVFSTEKGRQEFSKSVLQILKLYKADGFDLDWEYPAIESVPGFKYIPADRQNFTELIKTLRGTLGSEFELSFAAGGFTEYLTQSVEWKKVMPLVDYVNLMTYDLVNGNSKRTGHLSPLYSTAGQAESVDHAVNFLDSIGIPMQKVVIGLAFYARIFSEVEPLNNGLYQKGTYSSSMLFKDFEEKTGNKEAGYIKYWDNAAKAPYAYNASAKTYATYDNLRSVFYKTKYAKERKLGGVMFWELEGDKKSDGLLDMIYEVINEQL